jgi:hypothetical protein
MNTKIITVLLMIGQIMWAQKKETLPNFSKAQITISTNVYLKKSDSPYISFESKDSSNHGVRVSVQDGFLMLSEQKGKDMPDKVTIGYVNLEELSVAGAANVKSVEPIAGEKLSLSVNGAAKCKFEVALDVLSASVSGAGTCSLSGKATALSAIVSGASSLKAEDLVTEKTQINTSGASTARVNASTNLTAIVSGASTLKYAGDPKETQISQSGASNVKRLDKDGNSISVDVNEKQASSNGKDSTRKFSINDRYEFVIHEHKGDTAWYQKHHKNKGVRKQNWAGVDLFENGYLTADKDITLPYNNDYMSLNYGARNLGWNLNLFEKDFRFAGGRMQVVTGMGFSFNYYNLKNKTTLNADSVYTSSYAYNTAADYRKNRLRESWITVPLLLELNTSRRDSRNFHIAAGVIGGLKLGSSTKQIFTMSNHTFETIRHDDYNLFPFKLDATVRVGYGKMTLFATYSLTPLFEYGKGPEVYPFTVGVRIVPFD